eukprot:3941579-Rhodomonas_salina.2
MTYPSTISLLQYPYTLSQYRTSRREIGYHLPARSLSLPPPGSSIRYLSTGNRVAAYAISVPDIA